MTRSTLEELLARCERATGPDRALELDIVSLFWGEHEATLHERYGVDARRVTSSIDAIVGLIERELPGWAWKVLRDYVRGSCVAVIRDAGSLDIVAPAWVNTSSTPALALCMAFLRAKLSLPGGDE